MNVSYSSNLRILTQSYTIITTNWIRYRFHFSFTSLPGRALGSPPMTLENLSSFIIFQKAEVAPGESNETVSALGQVRVGL